MAVSVFDTLLELQKKYPRIHQIHGFYMDREQASISFDPVFDFTADSAEICRGIREEPVALLPDYSIDIACDTDFG